MFALGYESRVGKDTIAEYLRQKGFSVLTFAEPLHVAIAEFKRYINDNTDSKYRSAMIALANEAKRLHTNEIFVNIIEDKINKSINNKMVVTDLREIQQLNMLKKYGFKYVKVIRPNRDVSNPSIETELSSITPDIIIMNDGDLDQLYKTIEDKLLQS